MAQRLGRSPFMQETKRSDGVMVSLWRCLCGQLWQREMFPDEKQFWLPQAEPAPPTAPTAPRRPRFCGSAVLKWSTSNRHGAAHEFRCAAAMRDSRAASGRNRWSEAAQGHFRKAL